MAKTDAQINDEITDIRSLNLSDDKIDALELQRVLSSLNDNKINNDKITTYKFSPYGTSNFSQVIPADRLILTIVITNMTGLMGLKVGTGPGNDNIIPEQAFVGVAAFSINVYNAVAITLYFSGITSSTTAKIYTQ